jgi:hypothetical protein
MYDKPNRYKIPNPASPENSVSAPMQPWGNPFVLVK